MKSKKRTAHSIKKNARENQEYIHALNHSFGHSVSATVDSDNVALQGSDELYSSLEHEAKMKEEKVMPTPLHLKIWYWIGDNGIQVLLGTILLGTIIWLCSSMINLKIFKAEVNTKMYYLEKEINNLDLNSTDKGTLTDEIDKLNSRIESVTIFNINALEKRLDRLESQIDAILLIKKSGLDNE